MERLFILPDGVDEVKAYNEEKNVIIVIPKDTIVFAQKHRDDSPINIVDTDGMGKDFAKRFISFGNMSYTELGKFHQLLDDWFLDRAEDGVEYIASEIGE